MYSTVGRHEYELNCAFNILSVCSYHLCTSVCKMGSSADYRDSVLKVHFMVSHSGVHLDDLKFILLKNIF